MMIRRQVSARIGLTSILVLGCIALLAPDPAQAWSKGGYRGFPGHGYGHNSPRHSHHRQSRPYRSIRSYSYHYSPRRCIQVTKSVHTDGQPRKVTGTRCYDRHGNPYIVSGSRSLGGYYD